MPNDTPRAHDGSPADNPPADRPPVDNPPRDNPPADNPPVDRPPIDNPPADNPPADRPPVDNRPADNPPVDRPPADIRRVDSQPLDNRPVDRPPTDAPPTDRPPIDAGVGLVWSDLPGVRAYHASTDLRVQIDIPSRLPMDNDALAARWAALCAANPRFHDGPILAVSALDVTTGSVGGVLAPVVAHIDARHDSYRRLAVQPQVRTGVRLLGVTAIITAFDDAGQIAVLFAQRAQDVRIYPNLWEIGPSGGVNVPPPTVRSLDAPLLARAAFDEIEEEIGEPAAALLGGPGNFVPIAVIRDDVAFSDDVVLHMKHPGPASLRAAINTSWEYRQTQWVPLRELRDWSRTNPCIPPTHAICRLLAQA